MAAALATSSQRGCPVCGEHEGEVLHEQRFVLPEGHPLTGGYAVVCCARCGFAYADTTVSQAEYDRYYATLSHYESAETSTGGGDTPWDAARLREVAEGLADVVPREARVLDVGSANGGLLRALADLGFTELVGIDPSPACVATTRQIPGVRAQEGSLFGIPAELGRFDLVVLSHVLEHVSDLGAATERLVDVLAPGGALYLEVPDAARYRDHVVAPFQDFNTEHINHFSRRSLANLAAVHGLVEEASGTRVVEAPPPILYPVLWSLFRRGEGARLERDEGLCPSLGDYVARSREMLAGMDARLRAVVERAPEVVVWGAGQLAMKLLADTALRDARIAAIVDGNPVNQGMRLAGVPIVAPGELGDVDAPIVVTSTIHQDAIAQTIRERLGLENELVLLRD